MEECSLAFQQLKEYFSRPPIMFKLEEEEEVLFTYITVASHAMSLVQVRVDGGVQRPVYYVSKSLHKAEIHYLPLERPSWQYCMLHKNSHITSRLTRLWF